MPGRWRPGGENEIKKPFQMTAQQTSEPRDEKSLTRSDSVRKSWMRPGGESGAFLTEPYAAEFETMQQFQGNSVWLDGAGAREAREARLASFAVGRKPDEEQSVVGERESTT